MGKRTRIGIYFTSGSNWLGGVYYLINLVNSFSLLEIEKSKKPHFVVFYNDNSEKFISLIKYDHLEKIKIPIVDNKKAFIKSILLRKNFFLSKEILNAEVDVLYPFNDFPIKTKTEIKLISWYPDLQHKFYPEYFKKFSLWQREFRLKKLLKHSKNLVLSSEDVLSHFSKFYSIEKNNAKVLPFVSLTDKSRLTPSNVLIAKYKSDKPFFMVSNQFYKHKDHETLFNAITILKSKGLKTKFFMTGLMDDYRDPEYISRLKGIIVENKLDEYIDLLGVIPRNDQLSLMVHSIAVVQPSLFEGWSTVIEDAKSLGARIVASDINIHKEQLIDQGILFRHKSAEDLARVILDVISDSSIAEVKFNYNKHINLFSQRFLQIVYNAK